MKWETIVDQDELENARLLLRKRAICYDILCQLFLNSIFIGVLFVVCYLGKNSNSYNFNSNIQDALSSYEDVRR